MFALLCCVRFSFSVLNQANDWKERLRNDLFCVRWGRKPLTQSINEPTSIVIAQWIGYVFNKIQ